jgi:hypothetical protein
MCVATDASGNVLTTALSASGATPTKLLEAT